MMEEGNVVEVPEGLGVGYEPGWVGAFWRQQAPGALVNGSRVVKVKAEKGDLTPLGTQGTVLGSM